MRVLVVEDGRRLADGLKRGLEAEGFATDVAETGPDGLWMAREHRYDAIVLDVMLPGMSGFDVCRTLREDENWTPILMLTAKDGASEQAEGLDLGADDYLTKPFSYLVLLAHLRALIRRGGPARPTVLRVGDLNFDPGSRRAFRGEREIELTAREGSVLEYLMARSGDVLSKSEILSHVWDYDFDGDLNIVEVYIGHLRNKIDRPFDRDTLQTVRGAGYRLTDDGLGPDEG